MLAVRWDGAAVVSETKRGPSGQIIGVDGLEPHPHSECPLPITGACPYCDDGRWHGWSVGGKAIHVGPLPRRKSICLYTVIGNTISPLAYFKTEDDAKALLDILDGMALAAPSRTVAGEGS